MQKYTDTLIRFRWWVLGVFMLLVLGGLILMQKVNVNYDLAEYLPAHSMTKQAISAMQEEFGYPGSAQVMVENVSVPQAVEIKHAIEAIDGVKSVLWLDDVADVAQPLEMIPSGQRGSYYKDEAALFQVQFEENDYGLKTGQALKEIRKTLGDGVSIYGPAESSSHMRDVMSHEILMISLVVVPLCVLILILTSHSFIEPVVYLSVIGVSIAINMGTNVFFGQISFMTRAMAAVLQLAISLDYSLFFLHRYIEERGNGMEVKQAIAHAGKKSFSSITASALTTIAGFLALIFMQYRIGTDLGLVLAKGIVLSFLCVMLLMPVLIYLLRNVIDRTTHRPFIPSLEKMGKAIIKVRYVIIPLIVVILVPAILAQNNNRFLYGDSSGSSQQGAIAEQRQKIQDRFGIYNPIMLLVPSGSVPDEIALADDLKGDRYVRDVQALVTLADPNLPEQVLPSAVVSQFRSDHYSRMVVMLNIDGETPESFQAVENIKASVERYYPGQWMLAGTASSISDIKQSIESDSTRVSLFSILSVGLIVLLTFRSLSLPVILVAAIQSSIWINMSIPYFQGASLVYIGYLVVSSLQLGATIDYAILMSNRYLEFRQQQPPKLAAALAVKSSGISVMVSASILAVAGFAEGAISQISAVSEIGVLLGRGAALSGLMVLLVLPALLVLFDKVILYTTLGTKQIRSRKKQ